MVELAQRAVVSETCSAAVNIRLTVTKVGGKRYVTTFLIGPLSSCPGPDYILTANPLLTNWPCKWGGAFDSLAPSGM